MPSLAPFHPQIVHFAIALAVAGVLLRCLSLTGRLAWTGPAAAALLLASAVAIAAATRSGEDAHGPVERVPGSAQAVVEHEDWGKRAYRVFVVVGLRRASLLADAFEKQGDKAKALAALEPLAAEFPQNEWLRKRIEQLRSGS